MRSPGHQADDQQHDTGSGDAGRHGGGQGGSDDEHMKKHERRMYWRFAAMIATSTAVMFVLTYSNTYQFEHIHYSQERLYMALLMGGAMALVMLSFMMSMMYKSRTLNAVVAASAIVVFAIAYTASRAQLFIEDDTYMKGMIPHHSIAILTSERADIDDVRVRELANQIIETQRLEIKEMEWLLQDIEDNGPATTEDEAKARPVPDFQATAASDRSSPTDGRWVTAALESLLGVIQGPTDEAANRG